MRPVFLALFYVPCIACSDTSGACDSDGNSLLQARNLVRKGHITDAETTDAETILKTVKDVAQAFAEGSEVTMSQDDVDTALGSTRSALTAMVATFPTAHTLAQSGLNAALAAVEACHTQHGGEVLAHLEEALERDSALIAECNTTITEKIQAEATACKGQGDDVEPDCQCGQARKEIRAQESLCETDMDVFRASFCDHALVCDMLESCHELEAANFNTLKDTEQAAMITRQSQYITVRQSQCITDLIIAAMLARRPIPHADMVACDNVNASHLVLNFPELPAEPAPCPESLDSDPDCSYTVYFDGNHNDDLTVGPGRLSGDGNLNWNHVANSAREISPNDNICGVSFRCNTATGYLELGIADTTITHYSHIDHGIVCRGASSEVNEVYQGSSRQYTLNGRARNGDHLTDEHMIFINQDGWVEFSLNGVVYYTSTVRPAYPWHVAVDTKTSPSLSHVQYVECGERHLPRLGHGDPVEFDQADAGLTVKPGALVGTGNPNWYNPANSAREVGLHDGICGITFKCNTTNGYQMIGLSSNYVNYKNDIQYGIQCMGTSGSYTEVYEVGSRQYQMRGRNRNGNPLTDEYAIRINEAGRVEYALNGVVFRTSTRTVVYPWHVGVDTKSNPSLSDVEYIKCGKEEEEREHGEEVVFDLIDGRLTHDPGYVRYSGHLGWYATGNSAREIRPGDGICGVQWKCNTSSAYNAVGIATSMVGYWTNMNYEILCYGTSANYMDIYEGGSHMRRMGGRSRNGDPTRDVHSIQINRANTVEYALNGNVYHVSSRTLTYPWHVGFDAYSNPSVGDLQYISCGNRTSNCTASVVGNLDTAGGTWWTAGPYMEIDIGRGAMQSARQMTSVSYRLISWSYNLKFQVWRPRPDVSSYEYELIQETPWLDTSSTGYWGSSYKSVSLATPLNFEQGDYIGFYHSSYNPMYMSRRRGSHTSTVRYRYGTFNVGNSGYFGSSSNHMYTYQAQFQIC